MSLNTPYEGYAIQWSFSTWSVPLFKPLADELNKQCQELKADDRQQWELLGKRADDLHDYRKRFPDPRFEYDWGSKVKIKDHWFPEFQKWVKETYNYDIAAPEPITCGHWVSGIPIFTIEMFKNIKEIRYKDEEGRE